ncbi:hypothetical protein, partial [Streptomyces goshikiensis]|uniref:hypothetical protein n=1 Tax=Streptomyces goshikiensis TaxID=1942 RepID=UPI00339DDE19
SDGSTVSASVTFSLVIGASSMIGSYTERFTVPVLSTGALLDSEAMEAIMPPGAHGSGGPTEG